MMGSDARAPFVRSTLSKRPLFAVPPAGTTNESKSWLKLRIERRQYDVHPEELSRTYKAYTSLFTSLSACTRVICRSAPKGLCTSKSTSTKLVTNVDSYTPE